ncbi:hypothetical protein SEA_TRUCKEE_47 [Arthrobacter phage Truckee]|nr:hypothetical protein SEA_TRUCKEE_47 [Arthrobacter phage Truckee]
MSEENGSGKEEGKKMNYGKVTTTTEDQVPAETDQKKVNKVISGEIIERKPGLGRKIKDTFTGVDARVVGHSVIFDVILPQLKGMAVDAGTQAIERLILGESSGVRRNSAPSNVTNIRTRGSNYHAYNRYSGGSMASEDHETIRLKSNELREVVVPSRGDAQAVMDELFKLLNQYGSVSVSDYYETVGWTGNFTDNQWGWTNLNAAGVSRVSGGYRIELPRPVSIK